VGVTQRELAHSYVSRIEKGDCASTCQNSSNGANCLAPILWRTCAGLYNAESPSGGMVIAGAMSLPLKGNGH